jgi:hypothetical protein
VREIEREYLWSTKIGNVGNLPRSEIATWLNYKFFVVRYVETLGTLSYVTLGVPGRLGGHPDAIAY